MVIGKIYIIGNAHVFADPMLLRRTLSNLIANAIYYTNSGGKVGLLAKPGFLNMLLIF
jgi:signal transduction histidine kinase